MKQSENKQHSAEDCAEAVGAPQLACRVLYRTPHSADYVRLAAASAPLQFCSFGEVPTTGGYVIVPFHPTAGQPILFVVPDEVQRLPLPPVTEAAPFSGITDDGAGRAAYVEAFRAVKQQIDRGWVSKVVLSRTLRVNLPKPLTHEAAEQLFFSACQARPGSYVALWSTPQSGTWLVASPEVLLETDGKEWHTMALAGTMPVAAGETPQWSAKNREEQAIVADFIQKILSSETVGIRRSAPHTQPSGNIQHICTDFSFSLPDVLAARTLAARLHPTPAVCGMPREEALHTILEVEGKARNFYAGFSGPFNLQGQTHLYVSLRCMEIFATHAVLHAGGGIMPESVENEEWVETQRKMQTMLQLIHSGEERCIATSHR